MNIESTIQINAPIEHVFARFTDLENLAERVTAITNIEVVTPPAQMAIGTVWTETRTMFGKEASETMTVTELEVNKRFVTEAASHGARYKTEYVFTATENGVTITQTFQATPTTFVGKLFSVLFLLTAKSLRTALQQDMADLKQACESHGAHT